MPLASYQTSVPVVVDEAKCIADKGCTVCVDVCPLDVLRISDLTGKAYMKYDECWYCMPSETDVAQAAADSLAELRESAASAVLLPLVTHPLSVVRAAIFRALKALQVDASLGPAIAALGDADAAVRVQAVGVI